MTTPSVGSAQYKNTQLVSQFLQKSRCIDATLKLAPEISLKKLPTLTPKQKQLLHDLLNKRIPVGISEKDALFFVSIQELITTIQEIARKLNLEITDICLVGSSVQSILESDPAFFAALDHSLANGSPDAPFEPFSYTPNDHDIRVYFKQINSDQRFEVSTQLLGFYVELIKSQNCDLLARKVTDAFLNHHCPMIKQSIQDALREHISLGKRNPIFDNVIIEIIKEFGIRPSDQKEIDVIIKYASERLLDQQVNNLYANIFRQIRDSLSTGSNKELAKALKSFALLVPKNEAFKKLSNQKDKLNRYFIQSLLPLKGGIELMGIESLERNCQLSPDGPQISLKSMELVETQECSQGTVDRRLRVTRIIQKTTYAIDFLKHCLNLTLGLDAACPADEPVLVNIFIGNLDNPGEAKKFRDYIEMQSRKDPMLYLMFLFNCCMLAGKKSRAQNFIALFNRASYQKDTVEDYFFNLLLSPRTPLDKVYHLLVVLGMIYLRKKSSNQGGVEYILRNDLSSSILKLTLNSHVRPYFLPLQFQPNRSIEHVCQLVATNETFRKSFYGFYKFILGSESNPALEIHELILTLSESSQEQQNLERDLWRIAFTIDSPRPIREAIKRSAETHQLFNTLSIDDPLIWQNAPFNKRKEAILQHWQAGKFDLAWQSVEKDLEMLPILCNVILVQNQESRNLAWNLSRLSTHSEKLSAEQIKSAAEKSLLLAQNNIQNNTLAIQWLEICVKSSAKIGVNWVIKFILEKFKVLRLHGGIPTIYLASLKEFVPKAIVVLRQERNALQLLNLFEWCSLIQIQVALTFEILRGKCFSMIATSDDYKLSRFIAAQNQAIVTITQQDDLITYQQDLLELGKDLLAKRKFKAVLDLVNQVSKLKNLEVQLNEAIANLLIRIPAYDPVCKHAIIICFTHLKDRTEFKTEASKLKDLYFQKRPLPKKDIEDIHSLYPELSPQNWNQYWGCRNSMKDNYRVENLDRTLVLQWSATFHEERFWNRHKTLQAQAFTDSIDFIVEADLVHQASNLTVFIELSKQTDGKSSILKFLKRICRLRNCNLDQLKNLKAVRELSNDPSEEWVEIDEWFIHQYISKNQTEMACQDVINQLKAHPKHVRQLHYVRIIQSKESSPLLEELYELAESTWKDFYHPGLINTLARSDLPFHRKIVEVQFRRVIEHPERALDISLELLNQLLVDLLKNHSSEYALTSVKAIFSVPKLKGREELSAAAQLYHDQVWPSIKASILDNKTVGFDEKYSELMKCLPNSVFLNESYWNEVLLVLKTLLIRKKYFPILYIYNVFIKTFRENFSYSNKDLWLKSYALEKHYHYDEKKVNLSIYGLIINARSSSTFHPYLLELMKFNLSFFEVLQGIIQSPEMDDETIAPVLDLAFITLGCVENLLANTGNTNKPNITNLLEKYIYMLRTYSKHFGTHIEKSWSLIACALNEKLDVDKIKLQELIFYCACVVAVEKDPKRAFIATDKDLLLPLRNVLNGLKARDDIEALGFLISLFVRLYTSEDQKMSQLAFQCFDIVSDLFITKFAIMSKFTENPYYDFFWSPKSISNVEALKSTPVPQCLLETLENLVERHPELNKNDISVACAYMVWVERLLGAFCEKYDLSAILLFDHVFEVILKRIVKGTHPEETFKLLTSYSELICSHSIVNTEQCHGNRANMIIKLCHEVVKRFPGNKKFMDTFILKIFERGYYRGFDTQFKQLLEYLLEHKAYSGMELLTFVKRAE